MSVKTKIEVETGSIRESEKGGEMGKKDELAKIVGEKNVSDAREVLLRYSRDHSLVPPGVPEYVVWPTT